MEEISWIFKAKRFSPFEIAELGEYFLTQQSESVSYGLVFHGWATANREMMSNE